MRNCVPVYVNDNVTRYFDEVLSYDLFEVTLPEDRIPEIPEAIEAAAPRLGDMHEKLFCACHALAPSWEANVPSAYWEAWCAHPLVCAVCPGGEAAADQRSLQRRAWQLS